MHDLFTFQPVVVDSLFIFAPIDCGDSLFGPCHVVRYLVSFQVISILVGRGDLVPLLLLSSRCHVAISVLFLFLTVPCVGLQCVILAFPDHNHFLDGGNMLQKYALILDLDVVAPESSQVSMWSSVD